MPIDSLSSHFIHKKVYAWHTKALPGNAIQYRAQSEIRLFRAVSFGFLPTYRVSIGGETGEDSHHRLIDFACGYSSVCVKNKDKYSPIGICEI